MDMLKKISKWIIIVAVLFLGAFAYFFVDYIGYKNQSAPILMYHGIGYGSVEDWDDMLIGTKLFEKQIKYLSDRDYKIVSVEELAERLRNNQSITKYVAITFDDGYENNYTDAFPVLKKYKVSGTIYLIRNAIGTSGYLNDQQIREMLKYGMKIGSHTMSHTDLTTISSDLYQREITGSKMILGQRFLDVVIESISYPNGMYNDEILDSVEKAKYQEGVTGNIGVNTHASFKENPFLMFRVGIYDRGNGVDGFAKTLEKAYLTGYLATKGIDLAKLRSWF